MMTGIVLYFLFIVVVPAFLTFYAVWRVVRDENSKWVWAAGPVLLYWACFAWQLYWRMCHWWWYG